MNTITQKEKVFKLQMPMTGNMRVALLHDEKQTVYSMIPIDKFVKQFMGKSPKKYFNGYIDRDRLLHIIQEVKGQNW
jgi:hypothetical protein